MTEFTTEHLQKMLEKVQKLLARAEHPNTPVPEAETSREMANAIMEKYRIEEETARQLRVASGTAAKPIEVLFEYLSESSVYGNHYYSMLLAVMHHLGVRGLSGPSKRNEETDDDGHVIRVNYGRTMNMIGFDTDIQLVQMLYTNLRLTFAEKLEPKIDRSLSDEDNVYRLRSAGMERPRIGEAMGWGANAAQKVTKIYVKACQARGEDPKVVGKQLNAKTFRDSYADAFYSEIVNRLQRMKANSNESGAIVLHGRQESVNEAFYERYPSLRPMATLPGKSEYKPCERCAKAKSGSCRAHTYAKGKERPFSRVGWTAGTNAAREADLSRVTPATTHRLEG